MVGMRRWVGACALVVAAAGCDGSVCGPGTIERNGTCEPGNSSDGASSYCKGFTHFNPASQQCEADYPPTVCDPTTEAVPTADGVTVCMIPGDSLCQIACPFAAPGHFTICGTILDIETSEVVSDGLGESCDPLAPAAAGACSIALRFYDALAFAQDPSTAQPLDPGGFVVNSCGNFVAKDVPVPATGSLVVVTDDLGTSDLYVPSGSVLAVSPGDQLKPKAYVVRRTTDEGWTSSAGDPFAGQTFSEVGVDVEIHATVDGPVQGVSVSGAAYYFSDTDPYHRSLVDPNLNATGPNGTALVANDPLGEHTSTGGVPPICSWSSDLSGTIPGVVFVDEVEPTCM